jgi:mRNA interferase RelE/StbE
VPEYRITFARSARRELERLPRAVSTRILARIEMLQEEPRPKGCAKLQGPTRLWRIRVGQYRVVYNIDDDQGLVDVVVIRHRSEAYR